MRFANVSYTYIFLFFSFFRVNEKPGKQLKLIISKNEKEERKKNTRRKLGETIINIESFCESRDEKDARHDSHSKTRRVTPQTSRARGNFQQDFSISNALNIAIVSKNVCEAEIKADTRLVPCLMRRGCVSTLEMVFPSRGYF